MNVRCLTPDEVGAVLLHLVDERAELDEKLSRVLEEARAWELRVVCHNLFVARHIKAEERGFEKIERLYAIGEEIELELQEGGADLVEYLLQHERNPEETLAEALVVIQEGLSAHDYKKALRYSRRTE